VLPKNTNKYKEKLKTMQEIERLTTLIGELISIEINEVYKVEYAKENKKLTDFTIIMQNGKHYLLSIKENT